MREVGECPNQSGGMIGNFFQKNGGTGRGYRLISDHQNLKDA